MNAVPDQDHCDDAVLAGWEKGWHHGASRLEPKLTRPLDHWVKAGLIPMSWLPGYRGEAILAKKLGD